MEIEIKELLKTANFSCKRFRDEFKKSMNLSSAINVALQMNDEPDNYWFRAKILTETDWSEFIKRIYHVRELRNIKFQMYRIVMKDVDTCELVKSTEKLFVIETLNVKCIEEELVTNELINNIAHFVKLKVQSKFTDRRAWVMGKGLNIS